MKKNYTSLPSAFFIAAIIYWIFYMAMPQAVTNETAPMSEFSTKRALEQIATLSQKPHYVGSAEHENIALYLQKELQKLGLQAEIQEGYTLSDWGNLVKSKNIIARINGSDNSKALMLLSHYDSAPHSKSHGASDDGTGIATILEGVRAFLHNKTPHKNDIIVLFSDAEELGLNGAALFVTQHKWAKQVGIVLNFEARGTSGPSYMLMEVNKGNAAMVKGFSDAGVKYPVSNSLMYSIYKMLPNDTDLTVFREQGKIQGLNFAFIDNHFNYHTQQDDLKHLNPSTLAHQGTYIMPLLQYFSNTDLANLNADEDYIYFNTPFNFVSYPFSWVFIMLIGAVALFLTLVFIGFGKKILNPKEIGKGLWIFFGALCCIGILSFFSWKALLAIYPQYNDILQGFTYNGHSYMTAFTFLSLGIGFLFYRKCISENLSMNYGVAPLFVWLLINSGIALFLPGAGFFIIPVYAALIGFGYFIITQKTNKILNLLLSVPALIIFVPFITAFPIGLGLKMLFASAILVMLLFGLLLPVLGSFSRKTNWAALMLAISIGFIIHAHINSGYEYGKAKPNSLIYEYDADKDKASWLTYDTNLDEWTKRYLGENPQQAPEIDKNALSSKYNSKFTFIAAAPLKQLKRPLITFIRDTVIGKQRYLDIKITPNRKVNRYDIFADERMVFQNFRANGAQALEQKGSRYERKGRKILSYYVVDNTPLLLQFSISSTSVLNMELMESSFDLMENPLFSMQQRPSSMMPTPFVLNDAVVIKQKIKPSPKPKPIVKQEIIKHLIITNAGN